MSSSGKTIIFISHESKLFGAPKVLLQIIKYFHATQLYNILVICPSEGPFKSILDQNNIRTLVPECLRRFYIHVSKPHFFFIKFLLRFWDNVKLFFYFYKLFHSHANLIVYANTLVVRYIALPAKFSKAKLIWHIHEYFANPIKQWFHSLLIGYCADNIIAHSASLMSRLHFTQRQIQNKVSYFRYYSAFEREILARVDSNNIEFDLLYAGRISLKKGVLDLLKAIANSINSKFNLKAVIVGMFAEEDKKIIMNFIQENKLETHVIFPGFVPDIYEYILKSKVVVLPTYRDYFPMILLEALLLERPIIATKVGDIPNIVIHNKNGFLVEPGNILQLSEAIGQILDEKQYARFKGNVKEVKAQILSQSDDYQILRYLIDRGN